jgi:hypothetical protein
MRVELERTDQGVISLWINGTERVEEITMRQVVWLYDDIENMVPALTTNTKNQDLTQTSKLFMRPCISP